jgi:hypothetical protein
MGRRQWFVKRNGGNCIKGRKVEVVMGGGRMGDGGTRSGCGVMSMNLGCEHKDE